MEETDLGLFDLYTADEVFVTGTAAEIAPITTVDGRAVGDGSVGAVTKELMRGFTELTQTEGTTI